MHLAEILHAFLRSLDPMRYGSGDGYLVDLNGTGSTIEETITCMATDAMHFTVQGSISGALGTARVGSAFTSPVAHFRIMAGSTPWAAGDVIQFVMTPPGTLRCAGEGYSHMPSDDGVPPSNFSGALFRKALAANLRALRRRTPDKWN